MRRVDDLRGKRRADVTDWQYLNLNHVEQGAHRPEPVHPVRPLPHRLRGHLAPGDHGARSNGKRHFEVIDAECVGCNLCVIVCPVRGLHHDAGAAGRSIDPRTGQVVSGEYANWTTHPNNPASVV